MPNEPVYALIPLRLKITLASTPPIGPIDANTGLQPVIWRNNAVAFQLGFFNQDGSGADISNLSQIQVVLQKASNSTLPVVVKTIAAAAFQEDVLAANDWLTNVAQNAEADFSNGDTDQGLNGLTSLDYWLVILGTVASNGATLIYSAGPITIALASSSVPLPVAGLTSTSRQVVNAGDMTITPTTQIHTCFLAYGGAARAFNIILATAGILDGAKLKIVGALSGVAAIIGNVVSGQVGNPVLAQMASGDTFKGNYDFVYDGPNATWVFVAAQVPPY